MTICRSMSVTILVQVHKTACGLLCLQVRHPAARADWTIWLRYPSLHQLYPFTVWYPKWHPLQGNAEQNYNGKEQCLKQLRDRDSEFLFVRRLPFSLEYTPVLSCLYFLVSLDPLFLDGGSSQLRAEWGMAECHFLAVCLTIIYTA